jgi:hypothetical protein
MKWFTMKVISKINVAHSYLNFITEANIIEFFLPGTSNNFKQ